MKILLTGGAGYIGSVTLATLRETGHDVVVLDNFSRGHRSAVPKDVRVIEGDIADFAKLVPASESFDAVVHLAAFIAAGESMKNPDKYWQNNMVSTLELIRGMRERSIKKLVFASTAAVYGNPEQLPISESTPTHPTNTYGMTKLAIDMAITSESWAYGLTAASLRFFNVAGAYEGQGERHAEETHLIPLLFDAASGRRDGFSIFGDNYETPDGTCVRDYIHVHDLALAVALALERVPSGKHEIYNLANGKGFSNKQVIEAVKRVTGKDFTVTIGPRRDGDPAMLIAASQKAKDDLGWAPTHPNLDDMIRDAWEFYQTL